MSDFFLSSGGKSEIRLQDGLAVTAEETANKAKQKPYLLDSSDEETLVTVIDESSMRSTRSKSAFSEPARADSEY